MAFGEGLIETLLYLTPILQLPCGEAGRATIEGSTGLEVPETYGACRVRISKAGSSN